MKYFFQQLVLAPRQIGAKIIGLYQKLLSPDHGWLSARFPYGYCRHYPSCSQYAKEAILKHGLFKGGFYAFLRILRCNPFSKPKIDLIP